MSALVPCQGCHRHHRISEERCPFCGAACGATASAPPDLRVPSHLTRAAIVFAAATAIGACTGGPGDDGTGSSSSGSSSGSSSSGSSGSSGASGSSGTSGISSGAMPAYGAPPIDAGAPEEDGGNSSGALPPYGLPPIDGG